MAGGTSAGASRETAAQPTLCWTVDETQGWKVNLDYNEFFLGFPKFLHRLKCRDTRLQQTQNLVAFSAPYFFTGGHI